MKLLFARDNKQTKSQTLAIICCVYYVLKKLTSIAKSDLDK